MVYQEAARPALRVVHLADRRVAEEVSRGDTLEGAFRVWEKSTATARKSKNTIEGYRTAVKLARAWPMPQHPTIGDWEDWLVMLKQGGRKAATCNFYLRGIRSVLHVAARYTHNSALYDTARLAEPLPEPEAAPRCPPRDALARALSACRDEAERAFVILFGTTGLRRGEMLGLLPEDYDWDHKVLRVLRSKGSDRRKNGKPGHPHFERLGPLAAQALEWVLAHRHELKSRKGWHRGQSDGYCFPWGNVRVDNLMKRIRESLGADADTYFPRGTAWHAFRHLVASEVAESTGGDLLKVREKLGDRSDGVASMYCNRVRGATYGGTEPLERSLLGDARQRELVLSRVAPGVSSTRGNTGSTELCNRVGDPDLRNQSKGKDNV